MSDMVLATGLPFETVAGFTEAQFFAVRKSMLHYWDLMASVNGLRSFLGGSSERNENAVDDTAVFDKQVKQMKAITGKDTLDLWEIV